MLHGICRHTIAIYSVERIVAHGPLFVRFPFQKGHQNHTEPCNLEKKKVVCSMTQQGISVLTFVLVYCLHIDMSDNV